MACWRAHEIPPSRLHGEGVLIDVSSFAAVNRDFRLNASLLEAKLDEWVALRRRPVPLGAFLLIYTGWGRFWPDEAAYLGLGVDRNVSDLHFPGLHPDAG